MAAVAGGATGPRTEAKGKGGVPVALGGRHFAKGPATKESGGLGAWICKEGRHLAKGPAI